MMNLSGFLANQKTTKPPIGAASQTRSTHEWMADNGIAETATATPIKIAPEIEAIAIDHDILFEWAGFSWLSIFCYVYFVQMFHE